MGVNSPFHREVYTLSPFRPPMRFHPALILVVNEQAFTKNIHPDPLEVRWSVCLLCAVYHTIAQLSDL